MLLLYRRSAVIVTTAVATGAEAARWPTYIGLLIAFGGPPALVVLTNALWGRTPPLQVAVLLQLVYVGMAAAVVWIVLRLERQPLRSIGVRRSRPATIGWAVILYAVVAFALPALTQPLLGRFDSAPVRSGIESLALLPLWFRLVLAVSAGVIEETFYRGFAIERLQSLTGSASVAVVISSLAFAASHVPAWGWGFAIAADLPFGILLSLFYVWRRDLVANVLVHTTGLAIALAAISGV